MKSAKSESTKTVRSSKSIKVYENEFYEIPEIVSSLPEACRKYGCSYTVLVKKAYQQDEFKKLKLVETPAKYKKNAVAATFSPALLHGHEGKAAPSVSTVTESTTSTDSSDILQTTAVYDNMQRFVELIFNKINHLPRTLMQIIGLLIPSYDYLTKISFCRCSLDDYAMYELNKIIRISTITDISFDGTKFLGGDISVLMDNKKACIKYISLSGCEINDETCKALATRLHYLTHIETTLLLLNLSSNHITDEGAKHLGEALRSNRHLRYLNLADNHIGDDGAIAILSSLIEFVLTYDEIFNKRRRYLEYLKAKRLLFMKYLYECDDVKSSDGISRQNRKNMLKKKKSSATSLKNKMDNKKSLRKDIGTNRDSRDIAMKAEIIANELVGPFLDPFAPNCVTMKNEISYSLGNMTLSYLNLSYNRLMYSSVKKLVNVIHYQKGIKNVNQSGLVKVVIEGNNLPIDCTEYQVLYELTRSPCFPFRSKMGDSSARRRSRTARMSTVSLVSKIK